MHGPKNKIYRMPDPLQAHYIFDWSNGVNLVLHHTCFIPASYLNHTCIILAPYLHHTCIILASYLHHACVTRIFRRLRHIFLLKTQPILFLTPAWFPCEYSHHNFEAIHRYSLNFLRNRAFGESKNFVISFTANNLNQDKVQQNWYCYEKPKY
jgi:hypothetical protein